MFFFGGGIEGTGGSISIKHGNRIYMAPSGVQKVRFKKNGGIELPPSKVKTIQNGNPK